jgi:hypothetical protein
LTKGDVHVVRVTPEGQDVPAGRQVVVRFDRPMVPLGARSGQGDAASVRITPALACHWHWLDTRSLACELDAADALVPATRYTLSVPAGLVAEDGNVLKQAFRAGFATERPAIKSYGFRTWRGPGTPVVEVLFNQPVTRESVSEHLHFSGRARVLVEPAPYDREVFRVFILPGEKQVLVLPGASAPSGAGRPLESRRLWLVSPAAELPGDAAASLEVEPGLTGYAGSLRGVEHRRVVDFDTFPAFRFLGVRCSVDAHEVLIAPGASPVPRCNPLARVALVFSAPVIAGEIRGHLHLEPDLAGGRSDYDPWANVYPYSSLGTAYRRGATYEVALPQHLLAFRDYAVAGLEGVRDEFGRAPGGATAMRFATDHRAPRLRLTSHVAVLEKDAPTQMPVYVTNLNDLQIRYGRLTGTGSEYDLVHTQPLTRAWDVAYAAPLPVRELLGGRSGVVSGTLTPHPTPPARERGRYFEDEDDYGSGGAGNTGRFFAQVTPFAVHVKLGHYNTLVWVTTLAGGLPVEGARVRVYEESDGLDGTPDALAEARTDGAGTALLPGRETLDPALADPGVRRFPARRLTVRVDHSGDLALLPLDADFLVDSYRASRGRVWSQGRPRDGHVRAWGTTAQGVYKLGDTVQYKLYVRNQANRSLAAVSERGGYHLEVRDPTGQVVHEVNALELSEFGAYAGQFRVAPTGAVGAYEFRLSRGGEEWVPLRTVVADFTPAPFQVHNTLNGALFAPGDTVEVATHATLHGGGPYARAGTRVSARAYPEPIEFDDPRAAGFSFQSEEPLGHCGLTQREQMSVVHESEGTVDERGELTTKFALPDANIVYGRLEAESAVRDDRGKYVATRSRAEYRGRDRYVGLRSSHWMLEEGKPAAVEFLVLDQRGAVVPEVPVTVSVAGEVTTAARIRGAGNAYLTHYENSWVEHTACSASSAATPQECGFTPAGPGLYSIQASIQDQKGRTHTTELCTWVTGKGRVLWDEPEDMSLSLVPEKQAYKVGEHARVLVRNPFPGARALVTIERYGVIKRWVQPLAGSAPVIDFPVEPDFVPGFYLSVLVMAPRAAPVPGAGVAQEGVDLGRPTYRIGYLDLSVKDPYKALEVSVRSDRGSYRPRERVTLELAARAHAGAPGQAQPVEFAVAVLDEAVFDLIQDGRGYFDPYAGLYRLDPLDVSNFDILNRLVGLTKFEKKGANAGGDGGAGFDLRVVRNYVAYWNPSVRADGRGRARLEFQLPDNLTGWRVFALAVTPGDRLGLGEGKFASTKLTELQPALPNQLASGDQAVASFSVLNRAPAPRELTVTVSARGALAGGEARAQKTLALAPFERASVALPVAAEGEGTIRLTASAGDASDHDSLEVTLPVHRRAALEVAASYGTTQKDSVSEPVAFPQQMLAATGSLSLVLSPTVIGNLTGAIAYLRDYPYGCWEQRLSRAQAAAAYVRLRAYFPADFSWPGAEAVPQAVLDEAAGFQAPNGGMAFWAGMDERVSPYLSAATALAFQELGAAGYHVPGEVEARLDAYLERFLRERAAPTFYSDGMVSSVRAVALAALAARGRVQRADLERYAPFVPDMDLFGQAAFVRAALHVPGGEALAADGARRILAHADQSGGKFQFTERWDDGWSQLLATPGRSQCAILEAFVAHGERADGARLVGDVPFKLVRQITQTRGQRDHWENTQENVYCLNALAAYAALYEQEAPQFTARARLGEESLGEAQFSSFRDPAITLTRANAAADPGRRASLRIERTGGGRLYYSARLSYALPEPLAQSTNAGIEITREYSVQREGSWRLLTSPLQIARGELVRVDLYVSVPGARNFVVVDDPVPGGLEPVNRELATASTVDADAAEFQAAGGAFWFRYADWSEYGVALWDFYHRELRHDAARFYADYLPAGHYHLSYAAQAIAAGEFSVAPPRAQEMYDPDVYGKGTPARLTVIEPPPSRTP